MTRWFVTAICLGISCPSIAFSQDAAPAASQPQATTLDTPEAAYEFLTGLLRPFSQSEVKRVEKMLRAAMAADPDDMRWPTAITLLSRYSQNISDAAPLARRVVEIDPTSPNSWFALGVYLSTGGSSLPTEEQVERTKAAIRSIERTLILDPTHVGALEMVAEYHTSVPAGAGGSRTRAIELTDAMMAIPSVRWRGAELRARICMVTQDWEGVDLWFARGIEWAPDTTIERDLRMQQALLYINFRHEYEGALALALPYANDGQPDSDRFSFVVGQSAYRLGDCDLAVTHYQRVIAAGNPPPSAMLELAECLQRTGDLQAAVDTINAFLNRFPGHPKERDVKLTRNTLQSLIAAQAQTKPGAAPPPSR